MCAVDRLVAEAMNMCDRIATPDKRETMRIPTPSDIYRRPSFPGGPPIAVILQRLTDRILAPRPEVVNLRDRVSVSGGSKKAGANPVDFAAGIDHQARCLNGRRLVHQGGADLKP